jgi:hypothetical protein
MVHTMFFMLSASLVTIAYTACPPVEDEGDSLPVWWVAENTV